ncbi:FAD-linked sulfhydryl oxidase ERV1 [Ricinus communis]|uniref:Sulfhydryl oxidase n=1 Tax=Ricinus communis TaxID=3988 RepID=B9SNC6_RICCO|nr:FAD-linked sulfhydryl oxidase ERV1 [Ricinus communis]EEF34893.1 alr/erv, putative [Ricinus communis]|eukprot:XP_002527495.1 FAD-linked sulfhydryl oxidase ERV1 [Ricinus communis]
MSDNPLQPLFLTFQKVSNCIQTHFSSFISQSNHHPSLANKKPLFSISSSNIITSDIDTALIQQPKYILNKGTSAAPVTKEELGRATWTFLHTLAAQYPENPTRQQKKDVKQLMAILSRMYPCKECADHFREVLRVNPVQAGSHTEFSQWLCHVHNVVNRSLGKLVFPCERVDARWGKLECEQRACDLQGTASNFGD